MSATDKNQMHTDKAKTHCSRKDSESSSFFSAPLRLCVSSFLLPFICVHLIFICGKNAFQ
jgi:hypothetical protein